MNSQSNSASLPEKVASILREVVGSGSSISLHEPSFAGNEWNYVKDCLDTGWVSSVGSYVDRFEQMLAEFTGCKHAVVVVNGTAALHVSLLLAGVTEKTEVLIPTLTFIATANAVSYCGAIPHFVDSSEKTLGICPEKLSEYLTQIAEVRDGRCVNRRTGRIISALMPMHTFGHPVDLDELMAIGQRFCIPVVEDAAESLGSYYKQRHTGNFGLLAALSFNGNKVVTTGGGGAILTNDSDLAARAKHITTTARVRHRWEFIHDQIGFNYRLPNLNAALGCAQLERLPEALSLKRALAGAYREAFSGMAGLRFFEEPADACSNYWLNCILLDHDRISEKDSILELTNNRGLATRPLWTLMHYLPMYSACPRMDLSIAGDLALRVINIPSSPFLGKRYA